MPGFAESRRHVHGHGSVHTPASGELAEQFDQTDGAQASAKNLAWSYAGFITVFASRNAAGDQCSGAAFQSHRGFKCTAIQTKFCWAT